MTAKRSRNGVDLTYLASFLSREQQRCIARGHEHWITQQIRLVGMWIETFRLQSLLSFSHMNSVGAHKKRGPQDERMAWRLEVEMSTLICLCTRTGRSTRTHALDLSATCAKTLFCVPPQPHFLCSETRRVAPRGDASFRNVSEKLCCRTDPPKKRRKRRVGRVASPSFKGLDHLVCHRYALYQLFGSACTLEAKARGTGQSAADTLPRQARRRVYPF